MHQTTNPPKRDWAPTSSRTEAQIRDLIRARSAIDDNSCWLWMGSLTNAGYGALTWTRDAVKERGAHRASFIAFCGPIPTGLHIDHICRVRECVNPDHLRAVTPRANILCSPIAPAAINARKSECPRGHAYDEANTIIQRGGGRLCRTCQNTKINRKAMSA